MSSRNYGTAIHQSHGKSGSMSSSYYTAAPAKQAPSTKMIAGSRNTYHTSASSAGGASVSSNGYYYPSASRTSKQGYASKPGGVKITYGGPRNDPNTSSAGGNAGYYD